MININLIRKKKKKKSPKNFKTTENFGNYNQTFQGMYRSVEKERSLTMASRWDASESPPSPPPKGRMSIPQPPPTGERLHAIF